MGDNKNPPEPSQGGVPAPWATPYGRWRSAKGGGPALMDRPAPRAPNEGAPVAAPNEEHPRETSSGGHSTANSQRSVQDRAFGDGWDSRTPGMTSVGGLAMGRLTQVHPRQLRFAAMVSRSKSVAGRHRAQRAKILGADARRTGRASAAR